MPVSDVNDPSALAVFEPVTVKARRNQAYSAATMLSSARGACRGDANVPFTQIALTGEGPATLDQNSQPRDLNTLRRENSEVSLRAVRHAPLSWHRAGEALRLIRIHELAVCLVRIHLRTPML